jgi:hypothetical protein
VEQVIIWSRRVSSRGVGTSGGVGYHLEEESIIWRGWVSSGREGHPLAGKGIIWSRRLSSAGVSSGGGGENSVLINNKFSP